MIRYSSDMLEFIHGKCEAAKEPRKFVHDWIQTDRNPCFTCSKDKSMCGFYKELVKRAAIGEKGK